jgi:hypothetical protein
MEVMMKKLLLMVGLMLPVGYVAGYTIHTYNGSKYTDLLLVCYNHSQTYYNRLSWLGIIQKSIFEGPLSPQQSQKNKIQPNSDSSPNNPVYCIVVVGGNDDSYILTNETQVYFDGNGDAAVAFYGEDQYGTNGTNQLRTCLGTDGAMC